MQNRRCRFVCVGAVAVLLSCFEVSGTEYKEDPELLDSVCLDVEFLKEAGVPPPVDRHGNSVTFVYWKPSWDSYILTMLATAIVLRDAMNYTVKFVGYADWDGTLGLFQESEAGEADIDVERWGVTPWEDWFGSESDTLDGGPIGYSGIEGIYVPAYTSVGPYFTEFYKGFQYPETIERLMVPDGTEFPEHIQAIYDNAQHFWSPSWCQEEGARCPMVHFMEYSWSSWWPEVVVNLNLNFTVIYIGYDVETVAQWYIENGLPILFYGWKPTKFISTQDVLRVVFPAPDEACWPGDYDWAASEDSKNGIGPVDCDFKVTVLQKVLSKKFAESPEHSDAYAFASVFTVDDVQMNGMLTHTTEDITHHEIACNYLKDKVDEWRSTVVNVEIAQRKVVLIDAALQTPITAITVIMIIILTIVTVLTFMNWNHVVIKASNNVFMAFILLGCYFGLLAVMVVNTSPDSQTPCTAFTFLFGLGFMCVFSSIYIKTLAIKHIFDSIELGKKNFGKQQHGRYWYYFQFSVVILFELLVHTIRAIIDPTHVDLVPKEEDSLTDVYICSSDKFPQAWSVILIFSKALLLLAGVYTAFRVRKVASRFNESKYIFNCISSTTLICIIALPVLTTLSTQVSVHHLLRSICIFMGIIYILASMFLTKIYNIYVSKEYLTEEKLVTSTSPPVSKKSGSSGGHVKATSNGSDVEMNERRQSGLTAV